ncbi:MAG: hypothetical protein M3Y87_25075 [Myxococcota bacterium]|nr:hypothetical protein [Myxococcota bacterium]
MQRRLGTIALAWALGMIACSGETGEDPIDGGTTAADAARDARVADAAARDDADVEDDAAVADDAAISDAATDDAAISDAAISDAAIDDDAGADGGSAPSDAGTDAAIPTPVDAGSDAATDAGSPGGCSGNGDCAGTEYCSLPEATCSGVGACQMRPEFCIGIFDPVCGCDGTTYGNACNAAAAGVNVQHRGECGAPDVCLGAPAPTCCFDDGHCAVGRCIGELCGPGGQAGVCKDPSELGAGQCWDDDDCGGATCVGANVCPCGAFCFVADSPGTCT